MFALSCLRRQKKQESGPQRSTNASVPDIPAAPVSAVTAEAGKDKGTKRTKWRTRLFGQLKKPSATQESTTDATTETQTVPKEAAKKISWWRRLFKCCRRKCCAAPAAASKKEKRNSPKPQCRLETVNEKLEQDNLGPPSTLQLQDEVQALPSLNDVLLAELIDFTGLMTALLEEQHKSTKKITINDIYGFEESPIDCYGFPNIGQTCYMNSSLQGLLTLEDFMRDISRMEQVWSSVPEAQLMRRIMEIRDAHTSTDSQIKTHLLESFKEEVSVRAPEFRDILQKDAHEFLTSVLEQIRSLGPLLQEAAVRMRRSYTCPVEDNLVFRMENTRTCKSCGAQSTRQEEYTNLSLDLVPGGSVEDMLKECLMETELEFRCKCGGNKSVQRSSFVTLPRVLILHLKRFRFSPSFALEKAADPIRLLRDLVVSSKQGGSCYSLVSVISHFGCIDAGHYFCDSIHPDIDPDEPADCWLTFNDSRVHETTGSSVCEQQEKEAYILFYNRHV